MMWLKQSHCRSRAESVAKTGYEVDLIVNNAGVSARPARLWELRAAEFDNVIDVNVKGVANVIRAFVPAMIERT